MKKNAEVIVIGGGIIGNAAAYYLLKRGLSVIVLEGSDFIGNGGSSRNGGGVRQSGRDVRELPLVMYGIKHLWPTLSEELETDCEYHQDGNLRLGKNDKHKEILTKLATNARNCGLDVRIIDAKEVKSINPYLSDEVTCASWCPTDGHANPLTTTLGYYKMARRLGATFISGERVTELRMVKGRVRKVVCESGDVFEGEKLNKQLLADYLFSDPEHASQVNAIIHPAVLKDFAFWAEEQGKPIVALESAILFESGFNNYVDKVLFVDAPEDVRLQRAMRRDSANEEQIRARMKMQQPEIHRSQADFIIDNKTATEKEIQEQLANIGYWL